MKRRISILTILLTFTLIFNGCTDDTYRILKIYKIQGNTTVTAEDIGTMDAYDGMILDSGDLIKVTKGNLTVRADEDKYIYAETGTEFKITATGSEDSGKITIDLVSGSVTSEIQNKLSADSVYEINTPNVNMSVRGTVFTLSARPGDDGKNVNYLEVFNGNVKVDTKAQDGSVKDSYDVDAGNGLTFEMDDNGNISSQGIRKANISSLTKETVEYLLSIDDEHGNNVTLEVGDMELEEYYEIYYEECYEYEEIIEYEEIEEIEEVEEYEEIEEYEEVEEEEESDEEIEEYEYEEIEVEATEEDIYGEDIETEEE